MRECEFKSGRKTVFKVPSWIKNAHTLNVEFYTLRFSGLLTTSSLILTNILKWKIKVVWIFTSDGCLSICMVQFTSLLCAPLEESTRTEEILCWELFALSSQVLIIIIACLYTTTRRWNQITFIHSFSPLDTLDFHLLLMCKLVLSPSYCSYYRMPYSFIILLTLRQRFCWCVECGFTTNSINITQK